MVTNNAQLAKLYNNIATEERKLLYACGPQNRNEATVALEKFLNDWLDEPSSFKPASIQHISGKDSVVIECKTGQIINLSDLILCAKLNQIKLNEEILQNYSNKHPESFVAQMEDGVDTSYKSPIIKPFQIIESDYLKSLTEVEYGAISRYIGSYGLQNKVLRHGFGITEEGDVDLLIMTVINIGLVANALNRSSDDVNTENYTIRGESAINIELYKKYFVSGEVLEWKSFASTSYNEDIAGGFGGGAVKIIFKNPTGHYIGDPGQSFYHEEEHLMPPSQVIITGHETIDSTEYFTAEVVNVLVDECRTADQYDYY